MCSLSSISKNLSSHPQLHHAHQTRNCICAYRCRPTNPNIPFLLTAFMIGASDVFGPYFLHLTTTSFGLCSKLSSYRSRIAVQ